MYDTPPATSFDQAQPKKSNRNIIIAVIVAVLLCCCCCIGLGFAMQSQIGTIFSTISQQLKNAPGGNSNPLGNPSLATAEAMATAVAKGTLIPDGLPTMPADIPTMPADIPTMPAEIPTMPAGVPTEAVPSTDLNKAIPQGGLGNDILRADAWGYVVLASVSKGCNASDPTKTTITVLQKPASNTSPWAEKWTVTCMDGSKASFDVTFTPDSTGACISVSASK